MDKRDPLFSCSFDKKLVWYYDCLIKNAELPSSERNSCNLLVLTKSASTFREGLWFWSNGPSRSATVRSMDFRVDKTNPRSVWILEIFPEGSPNGTKELDIYNEVLKIFVKPYLSDVHVIGCQNCHTIKEQINLDWCMLKIEHHTSKKSWDYDCDLSMKEKVVTCISIRFFGISCCWSSTTGW